MNHWIMNYSDESEHMTGTSTRAHSLPDTPCNTPKSTGCCYAHEAEAAAAASRRADNNNNMLNIDCVVQKQQQQQQQPMSVVAAAAATMEQQHQPTARKTPMLGACTESIYSPASFIWTMESKFGAVSKSTNDSNGPLSIPNWPNSDIQFRKWFPVMNNINNQMRKQFVCVCVFFWPR